MPNLGFAAIGGKECVPGLGHSLESENVVSPAASLGMCSGLSRVCPPTEGRSFFRLALTAFCFLLSAFCFLIGVLAGNQLAFGQVSPAEIPNPQLKALESTYLPRLVELNRAVSATKFPLPFSLSRYVGLEPDRQAAADSRGIEFVKFHDRLVLKITGNYNVAYNADRLDQNERAKRTFEEVIVPILRLMAQEIPPDVAAEAIGFEIGYHVRRQGKNYEYEGKEILVVVFQKADAFRFLSLPRSSQRQDILNQCEIFLNGKDFGLALDEHQGVNVEALDRPVTPPPAPVAPPQTTANPDAARAPSKINLDLPAAFHNTETKTGVSVEPPAKPPNASPSPTPAIAAAPPVAPANPGAPATKADVDRLQGQYETQLAELAKIGAAKFHFVEYAPPSFVLFRDQVYLQLTLRNSLRFNSDSSSIYKRAAQSFDLFLAPQLRDIQAKLPPGTEYAGLDVTLLNQLSAKPTGSSEALEFILPLKALSQFIDAGITNQDLINQSVVLVNGVRIALNLQQVE